MPFTIKGDPLLIRILEKGHLEKLRRLRNDPKTNEHLTSILPVNEHIQEEWFRKLCLDDSRMYFAIEDAKGRFLGMIRCDEWDRINRSIRIGMDIAPEQRRKGIATEAYRLFIQYLFEELGLHRIWLLVIGFNKPAMALYLKLGFVREGVQRRAVYRHNRFHDYIMMSLLKTEYAKMRRNR